MAGGDNRFSLGKSAEDFYVAITSRSGSHQTESGRLILHDKYPLHLAKRHDRRNWNYQGFRLVHSQGNSGKLS